MSMRDNNRRLRKGSYITIVRALPKRAIDTLNCLHARTGYRVHLSSNRPGTILKTTLLGNQTRNEFRHALDRANLAGINNTITINRHTFTHGTGATHS